jgi:GT2 family glycosyltransferase
MATERKALLILGMHRAGTSALARVSSLRGARLPQHLLPANAGNASGYWEPETIVALNTRILASFDLAWDDPWASTQLPSTDAIAGRFEQEARDLILSEYGDADLFVIKDPRCTLLQGFWFRVLQSLGISPCPVVMMRPCEEVVASLMRRDATSAVSAGLLYVAYGLAASDATHLGASFVTYAQLMADWRGTTDRIAREQGFSWASIEQVDSEVAGYLRVPADNKVSSVLPDAVKAWSDQVWSWCRERAEGHATPSSCLDGVRAAWAQHAPLFSPLLQDRARQQRQIESEIRSELDVALRAYQETDARLTSTQDDFQQMRERLEQELNRLRDDYEQLQWEQSALRSERDDVIALYERTDKQLRQTQSDYLQRDMERTELATALTQLQGQYWHLRSQLDLVLSSRSWKLTRPLRFAMQILRRLSAGEPIRFGRTDVEPTPPSMDDPVGPSSDPTGIRPVHRPHSGLRRFLTAEFDASTAVEVVNRIDRYRLPIPGAHSAAMKQVACDESEAVAWATAISRRAANRGEAGQPDVSIVIPVFNQLPFTLACLDALVSHGSRYRFEILIGDDCSTDATEAALSVPIQGVRHIRHPTNLGFVRNCNETARHASGRHLLFLNNDTLVLPNWLDELIDALQADPTIGLAGSKLVYADGRLQECGAIVWRDGSAWNYGRLADPRRPEFSYRRDVDYVSGASIALSRELWQSLGGFDELFVPAYAEDADLAFRIRARGLRTVVQPLSQVIHFEGITSGTDLGSGAKAYQVDNLKKLHARWQRVLEGHRDNADQPELEKERAIRKRALIIDHCTPTPKEDAGSVVIDEVMQIFINEGYKVTFIPEDNFAHVGAATRALQRRGVEVIHHPAYSRMSAFLSQRQDPFDVIFLHRFGVGKSHLDTLRRKYPKAKILFLDADMHHVRELREAELSGDEKARAAALRTRDLELRVASHADVTLVHSDFEYELLRRELPDARILLFPLIHDPLAEIAPLAGREGVCFVGGFRHPPNADGIRWFVETTWPLVRARVPDATLHIVGSHMPPEIHALGAVAGVQAIGFVDDLDGFLAQRRISVAPLRYGAGAKGKVAGSLAQGVPVVCTPVAAEGMQLDPGNNVLVGATPHELAQHIAVLLTDDAEWQRLSAASVAYAQAVTSRASARERLQSLLETL